MYDHRISVLFCYHYGYEQNTTVSTIATFAKLRQTRSLVSRSLPCFHQGSPRCRRWRDARVLRGPVRARVWIVRFVKTNEPLLPSPHQPLLTTTSSISSSWSISAKVADIGWSIIILRGWNQMETCNTRLLTPF